MGDIKVNEVKTGAIKDQSGAGLVTFPTKPFFHLEAFTSSGITAQTGVINFNSVVTNQGSHWNSTDHRFEVPVTGLYQFNINGFGSRVATGGVMNSTADVQIVLQKSTNSGGSVSYTHLTLPTIVSV